jgi:DNA mismatch repair protein MutL
MNIQQDRGKIRILPTDLVSRIAAGEVVERPAAVVKELLDNSLDAGSARILVEVSEGGRGVIRVTDDGEGMEREDATLAFERHATSKLRSEQELSLIRTLGFRGEALPSIAAVSKVRMLTASRTAAVGTQVRLRGGELIHVEDVASAPGTQIEVQELFFNTPARKKFLKSSATEFSRISQVVQQAALCWPRVSFSLRHNGQAVSEYPAVSSQRDRLFQVYGRQLVDAMREIAAERPGCRVLGFAVSPEQTKNSRSPQDLFVNSRAVKNATVAHAVYDGYATALAKGRHPLFVLFLDVDPHRVDVNVHPTKREVRFADQDLIHQVVRQGVRKALGTAEASPAALSARAPWVMPGPTTGTDGREGYAPAERLAIERPGAQTAPRLPLGVCESSPGYEPVEPALDIVALGQISRTFLVAQVGTELLVIDQHTAHERVLFERLWRSWLARQIPVQPLLIPEPFELPPDRAALLQDHLDQLAMLGLEIEPFGSGSFIVRGEPAQLGGLDHAAFTQDLLEELAQWGSQSSIEQRLRPIAATLACHSAVRAGRAMELSEIRQLVADWVGEGLPMTCPHGRRVALRLPSEELAKIFGRV